MPRRARPASHRSPAVSAPASPSSGGAPAAGYRLDRPALHALAHPLRARLLGELRVHGPATATELAAALHTNTGATSYHLRRLEEVGLIVETGAGTGRRRVWAPAPGTPSRAGLDEGPVDEDDAAALAWLARDYVQHFADRAGDWLEAQAAWPEAWRESCGLADQLVQVTEEQLASLQAELHEVLERYRRIGAGNPAAKRVSVYTCPLPVDPPPRQHRDGHRPPVQDTPSAGTPRRVLDH